MIPEFEAFLKLHGKGPRALNRVLKGIGWTERQVLDKSKGRVPLNDADRLALTAFALKLAPFSAKLAEEISRGDYPVALQPVRDQGSNSQNPLVEPLLGDAQCASREDGTTG
jgi:hypothetical protein